ncbi:hypothetical protein F5148DRAFT_974135 [Russula earlei]|uniref:Uncharacterized protein n=1 Tax=Russula earlei TaxID=71964 RepID=A0ACC0UKC1_9AGAM|nr:hypothetical protein F5148DRAFT_974135 [Russula earlei]
MLANTNYSLHYDTHTYLAIALTQSSSLLADPSKIHPDLKHIGPAGALPDVHVFSVPKPTWEHSSAVIIHALHQTDGVLRVDVQEPRTRAKRGEPDLPVALASRRRFIDDPKDVHDL